jgi:hypothetical protein
MHFRSLPIMSTNGHVLQFCGRFLYILSNIKNLNAHYLQINTCSSGVIKENEHKESEFFWSSACKTFRTYRAYRGRDCVGMMCIDGHCWSGCFDGENADTPASCFDIIPVNSEGVVDDQCLAIWQFMERWPVDNESTSIDKISFCVPLSNVLIFNDHQKAKQIWQPNVAPASRHLFREAAIQLALAPLRAFTENMCDDPRVFLWMEDIVTVDAWRCTTVQFEKYLDSCQALLAHMQQWNYALAQDHFLSVQQKMVGENDDGDDENDTEAAAQNKKKAQDKQKQNASEMQVNQINLLFTCRAVVIRQPLFEAIDKCAHLLQLFHNSFCRSARVAIDLIVNLVGCCRCCCCRTCRVRRRERARLRSDDDDDDDNDPVVVAVVVSAVLLVNKADLLGGGGRRRRMCRLLCKQREELEKRRSIEPALSGGDGGGSGKKHRSAVKAAMTIATRRASWVRSEKWRLRSASTLCATIPQHHHYSYYLLLNRLLQELLSYTRSVGLDRLDNCHMCYTRWCMCLLNLQR